MLREQVRLESMLARMPDDEFALNNNHQAWMSRLIMSKNPDLAGLFETRERRS